MLPDIVQFSASISGYPNQEPAPEMLPDLVQFPMAACRFNCLKQMQNVPITRSSRQDKRLKANFGNKTVHFGSKSGSTFVDHGNEKNKESLGGTAQSERELARL